MALFYGGIILVATKDAGDHTEKKVLFKDQSNFFKSKLDSFKNYRFIEAPTSKSEALKKVSSGEFDAYMEINDREFYKIDSVQWISKKTLSIMQNEKLSDWLAGFVYTQRLKELGVSEGKIDSLKPKSSLNLIEIDDKGELKTSSTGVKSGIGIVLAFIVYIFIFLYGSMVMRSALEEKTSRIVEVVVSSVKPFQMMLGKILGVALVGLTQFAAWVILGVVFIVGITGVFGSKLAEKAQSASAGIPGGATTPEIPVENNIFETVFNLPFAEIILIFLIFFMGGFLLYSSMFAAIGAAVNQETDVQQFMLPISLPLVFGLVIAQSSVFQDPHGPMASIFSIIPFTSPVVMIMRSPFGVPIGELLLSIAVLIATFLFMVWITGRIYRIGILMYGKKPSWKQLGKWIFMKD